MTANELHDIEAEELNDWLLLVEKSFNVQFAQDEFINVQTFGDLSDCLIDKLTLTPANDCTTQQAFYKLRRAMTSVLPVDEITPQTLLADILPRQNRIHDTKRLECALGFKLHLLQPPPFIILGLLTFLVASLFGFTINFQIGLLGLLIPMVGFWLAARWGKELTVQTVGELAKRIVKENYVRSRRNPATINRNEIEPLLADWLCDFCDLSKPKFTREAKFIWALSA